jgi:hypothetical protein
MKDHSNFKTKEYIFSEQLEGKVVNLQKFSRCIKPCRLATNTDESATHYGSIKRNIV